MIEKIVSGGQTGADRAALDWAIEHGIPLGGWCPRGRKAEDGVIDARYHLQETPSADYSQRTEWNVRDADGTVIFSIEEHISEGILLTALMARKYAKPYLHLVRSKGRIDCAERLHAFIVNNNLKVLNVAGPRASKEPEVYPFVIDTFDLAFLQ
ncbi:MAG: putative molybdenum carrier protein [Acidobacteria bacterium]|nr:putative molybdenum carrier protein [Acidobacteriota bacterium]